MTIPAPSSTPPRGDRGDDTRQRLVTAAIDVFGRHGFEGASTRMLSAAAAVNQAAIPYHFGGKEGLYVACAEHIAARFRSMAEPVLGALEARIAETAGMTEEEARARLAELLETVAGVLVREESAPWARFVIREQMEPTEAFERLYGGIMKPMLAAASVLVGRILGEAQASRRVRVRTMGLIGQLVALRAARAAVLRHLGWEGVGAAEFEEIRAMIRENVASLRPEERAA
jgi:TetR/AcrR family transcriptional regulator, regulator of cefoperazone and chloramphenicol sensitivity